MPRTIPPRQRRADDLHRDLQRYAPTGGAGLRALRQERAAAATRARKILDGAQGADRDLTSDEAREFDQLMAEAEDLGERIARQERLAGADEDRVDGADGPPLLFRTDDGQLVRAVTRGESFRQALGRGGQVDDLQLPGAGRPNRLGRTIIEYATGRPMLEDDERRDMSIGGAAQNGNYLLSEDLSAELVDLLRANSILDAAGAATMPLSTYETRLVKVVTDPQADWRGEHDDVPATTLALGSVTMRPRSIAAMVTLSDELAEDAPNAPEVVEMVLGRAVGEQLDARLFRGDDEVPSQMGAGVLDTSGIGTVSTLAGSAPSDYDPWLDALELVESANVDPNIRIDSPRTKTQLAKLKVGEGDARQLPQPAEVAALRHIVSSTVPTNLGSGSDESVSVVGNFGRAGGFVLVGIRSGFRIEGTRVGAGAFEKLQVKIRIHGRYDIVVLRPAGLAKVTTIGPTE